MQELIDDFFNLLGLKPNFNQTVSSTVRPSLHTALCSWLMLTSLSDEVAHLLDRTVANKPKSRALLSSDTSTQSSDNCSPTYQLRQRDA